jgi:hypothetical protein
VREQQSSVKAPFKEIEGRVGPTDVSMTRPSRVGSRIGLERAYN